MDSTVTWIVVGAVVLVLLVVLIALLLRRRAAQKRTQSLAEAERLRAEAAARTGDVQSAEQRARQTAADAERKRAEAQRAERVAAEAHRVLDHERAVQEDAVRRADELDPRVDHRADDYEPITGPAMKASTTDEVEPTVATDGRHRSPGPTDAQAT